MPWPKMANMSTVTKSVTAKSKNLGLGGGVKKEDNKQM